MLVSAEKTTDMTLRDEIETLRLAVQFMTRLPVPAGAPYDPARMARSIRYYPLTGLLVGGIAALTLWIASAFWAGPIAVVLALVTTTLITGALHEDGFADMVDGFWGGHTTERRLEIMRDSRLGSYGALALIFLVLMNVVALMSMPVSQAAVSLFTAHMLSRCAVVFAIDRGQYVRRTGAGQDVQKRLGHDGLYVVILTVAIGILPAIVSFGLWISLGALVVSLACGLGLLRFSNQKVGGYTGDVLGAIQQLSCLAAILIFCL